MRLPRPAVGCSFVHRDRFNFWVKRCVKQKNVVVVVIVVVVAALVVLVVVAVVVMVVVNHYLYHYHHVYYCNDRAALDTDFNIHMQSAHFACAYDDSCFCLFLFVLPLLVPFIFSQRLITHVATARSGARARC